MAVCEALRKVWFVLLVICVVLQIIDVALHIAIGEVEVPRIIASVVVLLWAAAVAIQPFAVPVPVKFGIAACAGVVLVYVILNVVFLVQHGATNEGRLRIPFFLFVLFTMLLAASGGTYHVKHELHGKEAKPTTLGAGDP